MNVVREAMRTCGVCAAPVCGYKVCWRCPAHERISGVADVVASLIYAVAGTESAEMLSKYKNHPVRAQREWRTAIIADLLGEAIRLHERCSPLRPGCRCTVGSALAVSTSACALALNSSPSGAGRATTSASAPVAASPTDKPGWRAHVVVDRQSDG